MMATMTLGDRGALFSPLLLQTPRDGVYLHALSGPLFVLIRDKYKMHHDALG